MSNAQNWRLVFGQDSYADFSASVSPAVEKAVASGLVPSTVYVNVFSGDSITIGANEDPNQVLDLAYCRDQGITVRRRPNGGGAIYAGKGSAFIVFYLKTDQPRIPETAADAFPTLLGTTAQVLEQMYGIAARYRPLNDVEIDGRKLMPTSIKLENGVMTLRILLNVTPIDTEIAARALPMPPEKVKDKVHKD
ncbi:MAG: biotin/lipoate A/B protein ligase family protein, partial [Magnetospirillum sp.]